MNSTRFGGSSRSVVCCLGFKGLGFKGLGFKGLGFKGLGFQGVLVCCFLLLEMVVLQVHGLGL